MNTTTHTAPVAQIDLLPCPFCGSADVAHETFDKDDSRDFVMCNGCGVCAQRNDCDADPVNVWQARATLALNQSAQAAQGEPVYLIWNDSQHLYGGGWRIKSKAEFDAVKEEDKRMLLHRAAQGGGVQANHGKGFSMHFSREDWGVIIDGVMLEIERSEKRKTSNSESNSDARVEQGRTIIKAITAESVAANPAPSAAPTLLNAEELAALRRFDECAQDGEGWDVPKPMMARLAEIGVVQRRSGNYYQATAYGQHVLGQRTAPAQVAQGEPVAWALQLKNGRLEFNSGYGMFQTEDQAKAAHRQHLGSVAVIGLCRAAQSAQQAEAPSQAARDGGAA